MVPSAGTALAVYENTGTRFSAPYWAQGETRVSGSRCAAPTEEPNDRRAAMHKVHATAEIYPDEPEPGEWTVWSPNSHDDGTYYIVIFAGPDAERRAWEYAEWKYQRVYGPDDRR